MIEWDFEGRVTFLSPEEGGLRALPRVGVFPSFRYPEFDDGTPYDDGEPLDADVTFRFFFPFRERYETIHRERLVRGRRFELMEASRTTARGTVGRRQEDVPPIEADIERLLADLGERVFLADGKGVMMFLYHSEWECAVNLLWAGLSATKPVLSALEYDQLVALARRVEMDQVRMEKDHPIFRA